MTMPLHTTTGTLILCLTDIIYAHAASLQTSHKIAGMRSASSGYDEINAEIWVIFHLSLILLFNHTHEQEDRMHDWTKKVLPFT